MRGNCEVRPHCSKAHLHQKCRRIFPVGLFWGEEGTKKENGESSNTQCSKPAPYSLQYLCLSSVEQCYLPALALLKNSLNLINIVNVCLDKLFPIKHKVRLLLLCDSLKNLNSSSQRCCREIDEATDINCRINTLKNVF